MGTKEREINGVRGGKKKCISFAFIKEALLGGAVPFRVALCTLQDLHEQKCNFLLCTLFVYQVFGEHIQRYEIYIAYIYIIPSREVKKKEDDAAAPAPHKGRGGECW